MNSLRAILNHNPRIPSPSVIAIRILEEIRKDESSFADIANIIASDPALTAKILKVANSPYYSRSHKVTSIDRAVGILGTVLLKNLALSFVIVKDMKSGTLEGDQKYESFWRRAVTAAVGSEAVTALIGRPIDDIFVSAILHDIGMIVMYSWDPEAYQQVLDDKRTSEAEIHEIERGIFGFDHQELGSELLKKWGLPEEIYQPIRYHHIPAEAPQAYRFQAEVLGLSGRIAGVYHDTRSIVALKEVKSWLGDRFEVAEAESEAMIDAVAEKSREILSAFEIPPGEMKPFSLILQEANEALSRLNLSYEQLVMEYKQARDEAQQLAVELRSANEQLRERAIRDELTGLYNHRHFQEVMDQELASAIKEQYPISLVLFDIDNFKGINDTYGHLQGDRILRAIGRQVQGILKQGDTGARYGGEEFAVVLPGMGSKSDVSLFAEELRHCIERLSVEVDGRAIGATVSIGVASFAPGRWGIEKSRLISAADQALYASKRMGKNRWTLAEAVN